jgi:putative CocE/NonD family hydrolase
MDSHWDANLLPPPCPSVPAAIGGALRISRLLHLRDGTLLAVDCQLPHRVTPTGERLDCVLVQHRYGRAWRLRWPFNSLYGGEPICSYVKHKAAWLSAGLAVVSIDVRGTGASHGVSRYSWSEEEQLDSREVLDFVAGEAWSSGRVLLFGHSYDANAAIQTVALSHPSVIGAVALCPFLDLFSDISHVGGTFLSHFSRAWSSVVAAIDSQRLHAGPGAMPLVSCFVKGVARAHPSRSWIKRALDERRGKNWVSGADGERVTYADDILPQAGVTPESISFSKHMSALTASNIPILWISGFADATAASAAAGFQATRLARGSQLVIGQWGHTMKSTVGGGASVFPLEQEVLRFMLSVRNGSVMAAVSEEAPRVRLFVEGEGWLAFPSWPTTVAAELCLGANRSLTLPDAPPAASCGYDEFTVSLGAHPSHPNLFFLRGVCDLALLATGRGWPPILLGWPAFFPYVSYDRTGAAENG